MRPRAICGLLLVATLLAALTACEQFDNSNAPPDPGPGPGPGPDPDPDPDPDPEPIPPPVRSLVRTPGDATVQPGTTIGYTLAGDPIGGADAVTFTLTPDASILAQLPPATTFGDAGTLWPSQAIDPSTVQMPRYRLPIPGTYTLRAVDRGPDYEPIIYNDTVTVADASARGTILRPQATEVTGYPAVFEFNEFRGVMLGSSGIALSEGPEGEFLVLVYRGQTNIDEADNVSTGWLMSIGHPATDLWSTPELLSTEPGDFATTPSGSTEKLQDTSATLLQSYGISCAGRSLHWAYQDIDKNLVYRAGTIGVTTDSVEVTWGDRTVLESGISYRTVPLAHAEDPASATLVITSGSVISTESLVFWNVGTGAPARSSIDITRSSSDGSRISAHDALRTDDGRIVVAALENGGPFDPGINVTFSVVTGPDLTTSRTLATNTESNLPPSVILESDASALVGFIDKGEAKIRRADLVGPPGVTITLPPVPDKSAFSIDLAPRAGGGSTALVLDTTGSLFDNLVGKQRYIELDGGLTLTASEPAPASFLETLDSGVGFLAPTSAATYLLWQEKAIALNRNSRILAARTL